MKYWVLKVGCYYLDKWNARTLDRNEAYRYYSRGVAELYSDLYRGHTRIVAVVRK